MPTIYHLTNRDAWESAQPGGEYEAPSLAEEGFIHCSKDIPQMLAVAERLYKGRADLIVLDVDTVLLSAPVKHEASRSGEIYPHIFGRINADAVLRSRPLVLDADGRHRLGDE